jgi:site-specific DNA-methyltransferase (adenine-specific)
MNMNLPVNTVILGDSREKLKDLPDNSVDSIVTDPPAGVNFMGREWDNPTHMGDSEEESDKGHKARDAFVAFLREIMVECLRVLKPGGHILVWSLPRTSAWTHRAVEDAGFDVKDIILHVFGSGFPKSLNPWKAGARDKVEEALCKAGVEGEIVWK